MSGEAIELATHFGLAMGSVFTIYLVFERALYLGLAQLADPFALKETLNFWKRAGRLQLPHNHEQLGWLSPLLLLAKNDPALLWKACHRERSEIERYWGIFATVGSIGMVMGLLASFLSLKRNAMAGVSMDEVLGIGITTSIWGVGIAVVAKIAEWVVMPRAPELRLQTDEVIEALDQLIANGPNQERLP